MEQNNDPSRTGFSEDYVKELRQEAANWRTKVRELQEVNAQHEVKVALLQKGLDVDPKWIDRANGETIEASIDRFIQKYPQFQPSTELPIESTPTVPHTPKPLGAGATSNSNTPGPKATGSFANRTPDEIKKDPKARAALRRQYRELLAVSSNQKYQGE